MIIPNRWKNNPHVPKNHSSSFTITNQPGYDFWGSHFDPAPHGAILKDPLGDPSLKYNGSI